ncbi:MAG: hypothetical protein V3S24_20130, partial [Candidatus Tectomicrobia bacterium]
GNLAAHHPSPQHGCFAYTVLHGETSPLFAWTDQRFITVFNMPSADPGKSHENDAGKRHM